MNIFRRSLIFALLLFLSSLFASATDAVAEEQKLTATIVSSKFLPDKPHIQSFLQDGEAESYDGVKIMYTTDEEASASTMLYMYRNELKVVQINLQMFSTKDEIHNMIKSLGFEQTRDPADVAKEHAAVAAAVEVAAAEAKAAAEAAKKEEEEAKAAAAAEKAKAAASEAESQPVEAITAAAAAVTEVAAVEEAATKKEEEKAARKESSSKRNTPATSNTDSSPLPASTYYKQKDARLAQEYADWKRAEAERQAQSRRQKEAEKQERFRNLLFESAGGNSNADCDRTAGRRIHSFSDN